MKGGFITFEGLDGAGTTTQTGMLVNKLKNIGHSAQFTGEPTERPIGVLIRQILKGQKPFDRKALALLFAADRLDHCETLIRPLVNRGFMVISDRYIASSLAYQVEDAPMDWVVKINEFAIPPDLVIFLKVSPEIAMKRVEKRGSDREIFEKLEFQQRVMQNYLTAIEPLPNKQKLVVDGTMSKESIHDIIMKRVGQQFSI